MSGPTTLLARLEPSSHKLRALGFFLAGFFAVWTLWALLLVRYPALNQGGVLRAIVRVSVWIVPTYLFIRFVEGPPVLGRLEFKLNRGKGVVFGFLGFLVLAAMVGVQHGSRFSHFAIPTDPATWLNAVISAPIAEEVLFRGLVFRVLLERLALWSALAVSALLFALVHLPYWWLSGAASPAGLVLRLGSIFAYGVFFGLLYHWSGSLFAPLLCHMLNNLVTSSIGL
jgi:membrane protease YdiL (CAAX protease family)